MDAEYIIFCDESDKKGKFYSNFYGGAIVGSSQYQRISERLNTLKLEQNLLREIKWERVTERYLAKYFTIVNAFFDEIKNNNLRLRIMFRPNSHEYLPDQDNQVKDPYFMLYYQFIKHSFGLDRLNDQDERFNLRLYFDTFPDTKEKSQEFINYLMSLPGTKNYQNARFSLMRENITEVDSKDHVILQCLDIVLGSMSFRLNEKHKEKLLGKRIRGSRTKAKEKLYKEILKRIREIHKGFNVGQSTSLKGDTRTTWSDPYMHWRFIPKSHIVKEEFIKQLIKKKKNSTTPT